MHSINASILVNAPVDVCYQNWMDFEKFPTFMSRVVSVRPETPEAMLPPGTPPVHYAVDPQKDMEGVSVTEVLHEVAVHGNQVWHWEVKGPLGNLVKWTAGIVMNLPNKAVSWASLPEDEIPNSGTVNFLKSPASTSHLEKTLITITMSFSTPVGFVGELLSDVVGYGDNLLSEALGEFKDHVEQEYSIKVMEEGA